MTLSARTRFEILKRDGFKCRYCGATAAQTILHVDHVVAESAGGTDDPSNLVAACSACNLGKSNKPLDALDPKRAGVSSAEAMREHADLVRAYLDATREVEAARDETVTWLVSEWGRRIGYVPPRNAPQVLRAALMEHPTDRILRAMDATGSQSEKLDTNVRVITYFRGCLKNMKPSSAAARAVYRSVDDFRTYVITVLSGEVGVTEDRVLDVIDDVAGSLQMTMSGPMADDERAVIAEAFEMAVSK